jgi:predicted ABC-type exoprotein transport system permease subunit
MHEETNQSSPEDKYRLQYVTNNIEFYILMTREFLKIQKYFTILVRITSIMMITILTLIWIHIDHATPSIR